MDFFWKMLDDQIAGSAILGVGSYLLVLTYRRASVRWVHWLPLFAKLARWGLYAIGIGLAVQAFRVLSWATAEPLVLLAALAGLALAPAVNKISSMVQPREKVRRGAKVADVATVNAKLKSTEPKALVNGLKMAGITVPITAEPYHYMITGGTGSGKSVFIRSVLDQLEARGDTVIVVDSGGGFASRYFRQDRDFILNPFDDRCVAWSPTAELEGPWDAEALAKSMIPDGVGESKEWNGYAQTFVSSVLKQLLKEQRLSVRELMYYVQAASLEELGPFLAGTAAAASLGSEKTFGSIRTIAANYLNTYAYLTDTKTPFSVAKYIKKTAPGFLFLTYRDDQLDSLRNLIACVLDVVSRTILALPDNESRRIWLVIDEFASIGKVQSIEAVATKARKKGGCLMLGIQAVSQIRERYGEQAAQTILSCLSSWLILRSSDPDTSEYISKYIGETEISRMTRGESSSDSGGTDSLNEQIQTQRAIMPAQLQSLDNLYGFFKLRGNYPIANIKLEFPAKRPDLAMDFLLRDFEAKPMLDLTPTTPMAAASAADDDVAEGTGIPEVVAAPAPAKAPEAPVAMPHLVQQMKRRKRMAEDAQSLEGVLTELTKGDGAEH